MRSQLNQELKKMDDISNEMRVMGQGVSSLEQNARQSRLAMEADGQASTKTRERTEGAATGDQAKHGDSCSADRVGLDPMCSTASVMTSQDLRHPLVQGRMPW